MSQWVVRAGIAFWRDLQRAYRRNGRISGFSVQYAPGLSWQELAKAGQFPHAKVGYADRDALVAAVAPLGYELRLIPTPGRGYHHELSLTLLQ
jgi:hypothetical protein